MIHGKSTEGTEDAAGLSRLRRTGAWIFDLDNTLYPSSAGMFEKIDRRMCAFIADYLAIDAAAAYRVQKSYFREHGTTLKGLMDRHGMDPGPYLEYVHAVDLEGVAPAPVLAQALARLPGRKLVFTNASAHHARRILARLGIEAFFDGIFDIAAADFIPKPDPGAYAKLVRDFALEPAATVMVEDVARNLGPAAAIGMTTVWVENDRPWARADHALIEPDFTVGDLAAWLARVASADG